MKSAFALLAVLLFVSGCGSEDNASASDKKPEGTPAASPQEPAPDKTPAFEGNPNRRFQLKDLAVRDLRVNGHPIHAWIMDNEGKRQEGMMWLKEEDVKDDQGMLFVFPVPQPGDSQHGFWMHNTILPLDIVYVAKNGDVVNVQQGKPFDETSLPAKGEYLYTLELKGGQAGKLGIKPGTKVEVPDGTTANE